MTDEPNLPEILQAEWAKDQVLQLFADLAAGADIQHVQLRTVQQEFAASLAVAKQAFVASQAEAIQIRYRFESESWCDTIMPGEPTTKIIRNRMPGDFTGER